MVGVQYTICYWAINRIDPQNLLSMTLDVPLHMHSMFPLHLLFAKAGRGHHLETELMTRGNSLLKRIL